MMYSNFVQKVWYTPPSQINEPQPVSFQLKTLTYRFVDAMMHSSETLNGDTRLNLQEYILANAVLDFHNIQTDLSKEYVLDHLADLLPEDLIKEVIDHVIELWMPSADFMSTLVTTIELMVDPRFSDSTYHCKTCQAKGLDRQRNCPLRPAEDQDVMFSIPFMDEMITQCPVAKKDERLGGVVLEGYNFRETNSLPEAGGMGDQPIFFVLGSQHLAERLKHFQRKAEEESMGKLKNK